jgi:hypothetical protein
VETLAQHLAAHQRRLAVHTWNDSPVLESDGQAVLEAAGFYRDYPAMAWERQANTSPRHRQPDGGSID